MKDIDYHEISEIFDHNGRKFMAIEKCDKCDLIDECRGSIETRCVYEKRLDFMEVIYVEVDKRKELLRKIVIILAVLLCSLFISTLVVHFQSEHLLLDILLTTGVAFVLADIIYKKKYGKR